MDNSKWESYKRLNRVVTVGTFENEHGERYVIYRYPGNYDSFITGDEMDWSTNHPLFVNGQLTKGFMFSNAERDQIAKIVMPTFEDSFAAMQVAIQTMMDDGLSESEILARFGVK